MKYLEEVGGDIHAKDNKSKSVLHYAVQSGSLDTVKFLISKGCSLSHVYKNKKMFHYIAKHGTDEMIKFIIDFSSDVNEEDEICY